MLTLINTNSITPLIAPIGLDYVSSAARQAGIDVEVLDLSFADKPLETLNNHFAHRSPQLVGISFRNSDDCFWPSADWFVPGLKKTVKTIRSLTDAPIVIGGVGFSIFARSIMEYTGADFGIRGDGETAMVMLMRQLQEKQRFTDVPGLLWKADDTVCMNSPAWPDPISIRTSRDALDNLAYFNRGGQSGLETKRGCNRKCIYCADPRAKGVKLRLRDPAEVADEVEALLSQGIDVLHLCDSEFNIPRSHAYTVCEEFNRRLLGSKVRWYAYLSPVPFDAELARVMAQAGCAGIDFTGDSCCSSILQTYRQNHTREDLANAVAFCRQNKIAVMIDLLLGGPGETPQTLRETIEFIKQINPDCAGAALGIRIYPGTKMEKIVTGELKSGKNANIRRKYSGPIDLFKPTFYISQELGEKPAQLVKDLIDADKRFFEPDDEQEHDGKAYTDTANYNYNENLPLVRAIQEGARGAYWHILRQLRGN